ncbi:DUF4279 domain-containing protein [Paenibacillus bovis]|uniref:DUF4279 domain-containing protein n=1 Tax=Paenibacillus bovis TaxID=1616788 RepID=A0A172ZAG1_9BACL|nr:DUF4279 domain-containing protein [Paenibacillus bovis]ANF94616.1 hypothetical protein AR543_00250 [Paenibacillus bovis]
MSISKIRIDFWLTGDLFEADEVSEILQIEPTKFKRKEEYPLPQTALTSWKLSTKKEECKAVCWQFEKLINLLKGKEGLIIELCEQYELTASFTVVVEMEAGNGPELVLTKDIILFIAAINAEVGFDLYID